MEKGSKIIVGIACFALLAFGSARADTTVTVNPGASWIGFMNVFEIPQNGGGYVFGSGWGTADLKASFSGPVLTLSENNVGDPNPFWYIGGGGPGAIGNKTMDASMYVEPAGSLPGQNVTFTGVVLANTLVGQTDALGNGWTSVAFIKDFAPDYSSFVQTTVALTPGVFSISLNTIADAARHVQYGFETIGPDVWATDAGLFGDIQITAVPEPSSIALSLIGLFGLSAVISKKRQN